MKLEEKVLARKLRHQGKTYSEILTNINVAKGTLSHWLKDIELTDGQKLKLKGRAKSRYAGAKANQRKSFLLKQKISFEAKQEVQQLVKSPLFVAGLTLYWAEGTKNGTTVAFTNSDPRMIRLMMKWFRSFCGVSENKFRILIFLHSLLIDKDWLGYWSNVTDVTKNQFIKPYVKPSITKHRKNKLYEGTCAIRISDGKLLERTKGWQQGFIDIIGGLSV